MRSKHEITRAAGLMSLATSSSRILGLIRDSVMASLFGAGLVSDAFIVAFRIPNLLRDLLAEGALSSAFVPIFSKVREQEGDAEAWRLTGMMLNALAMVLAGVVTLGIVFSPLIVSVMAPGFSKNPAQFQLTVHLNRMLFPFIACMAFGALFTCALNARHEFVLPAFAPALTNVSMILAGLFLCKRLGSQPESQVVGWALGALAGGVIQFAVHIPPVVRGGFRLNWQWPFRDAKVLKIFGLMLPAVFSLSITQINLVINTILASLLPSGSVTILQYGNRLMQLPLGIFGVAIATATLPTISAQLARGEKADFKTTLAFGMRLTGFITVPAMAGLIVLAEPINQLLFRWGRFDASQAHEVALVSICYSAMIVSASLSKLLTPAFYALEEPSKPVRISVATFFLNLALNLAFMVFLPLRFRILGLAASATLASFANALALSWFLRRKVGPLGGRETALHLGKALAGALGMAALIVAARRLVPFHPENRAGVAAEVVVLMAAGICAYFGLARWLGLDEWKEWFRRRSAAPALKGSLDEVL